METEMKKGLSGNQLKILALIAMTCDHVGVQLLPQVPFLRIIGRLAFPIFAYMIAEGCTYTTNKKRYLLQMAGLALLCQVVYFLAEGSLYMGVLVTFTFSIILCYLAQPTHDRIEMWDWVILILGFDVVWFLCEILPKWLPQTDYGVDYGIWGVIVPLLVFYGSGKKEKLILLTVGMLILAFARGGIQWYGLAAIPLMFFYSGERGTRKLKYLFYVYYPLHLAVIYGLSLLF